MQTVILVTLVSVCECLSSVRPLQNGTIEWKFAPDGQTITTQLRSSKNLRENYSQINLNGGRNLIGVQIRGNVPIIFEDFLKGEENLNSANFSDIGLKTIRSGSFTNLARLNHLDLSKNELTEVLNGSFVNLNVIDLKLNNNKISVLHLGAFQNLTQLSYLDLSYNQLREIRRGVFVNIKTWTVDLSHNSIMKLESGVFGSLSSLLPLGVTLLLKNNELERIDPEVFNNRGLFILNLENNRIREIRPGDLTNVPNLYNLTLVGNKLVEIPEHLFNKSKISILDFSRNEISVIQKKTFNDMQFLYDINLDYNKLNIWDAELFSGSSGVHKISMAHNTIEEIPKEAFKNYQDVYFINLKWNKIRNISNRAFSNTSKLNYLILSDNEIETWNEDLLQSCNITVIGLDLRRNKLKCLEGDLYRIFRNVRVVWLEDNPYDPTCLENVEIYRKDRSGKHLLFQEP